MYENARVKNSVSWFALVACAATPALAQDVPTQRLSYGVELGFGSGHADRGFMISDRPVVQPVTWVDWSGAEFSVWSNFPIAQNTDGSRPRIVEMELVRAQQWGHLSVAPAVRMFFYHDAFNRYSERSMEGWLYLSYATGPVRWFTNQSLDFLTYRGAYYGEAGVTTERSASGSLKLGGALAAGWASATFNDAYAGVPRAGLDRLSASAWLTVHLTPHVYVGPYVEYSSIVNEQVRVAVPRPTYLVARLTTGAEF